MVSGREAPLDGGRGGDLHPSRVLPSETGSRPTTTPDSRQRCYVSYQASCAFYTVGR